MISNNKLLKYIILFICTTGLLCGSCEEIIFLYNNRGADCFNGDPDICFNQNIINKNESIERILESLNGYNKNLLSNVKNINSTFQYSLNNPSLIAIPPENDKPDSLLYPVTFPLMNIPIAITKISGKIFRPPETIESPFI